MVIVTSVTVYNYEWNPIQQWEFTREFLLYTVFEPKF